MAAGKRKGSKAIIWMEIGLFLAAAAAAYFIFMYVDLLNTIDNANIFLSAIKNGKLLTFYEYSVERAANRYSANYSLPVFILFAVWQAPMLLVTKLLGKNYQEWSISLLWSKLLLVLFMIAVAYLVYKIVLLCGQNRDFQSQGDSAHRVVDDAARRGLCIRSLSSHLRCGDGSAYNQSF